MNDEALETRIAGRWAPNVSTAHRVRVLSAVAAELGRAHERRGATAARFAKAACWFAVFANAVLVATATGPACTRFDAASAERARNRLAAQFPEIEPRELDRELRLLMAARRCAPETVAVMGLQTVYSNPGRVDR